MATYTPCVRPASFELGKPAHQVLFPLLFLLLNLRAARGRGWPIACFLSIFFFELHDGNHLRFESMYAKFGEGAIIGRDG